MSVYDNIQTLGQSQRSVLFVIHLLDELKMKQLVSIYLLFSHNVFQSETTVFQSWLIRVIGVGSGSFLVVKYEQDLKDDNNGFAYLS